MSLQKHTVPIDFTGGLDTKTDSKVVLPTKLLELENGVFTKYGTISKRFGYRALSLDIEGGGSIVSGSALGIYNDELNLYSSQRLYSYLSSTDKWIDKGPVISAVVKSQSLVRNSYTQSNVSTNSIGGFTCTAWNDSRGSVRYSVVDQATGLILVNDTELDTGASNPKVMARAGQIVIFYYTAGTTALRYKYISLATPTVLSASGLISTALDPTYPFYDIALAGTKFFCAFNHVSNKITVQTLSNSLLLDILIDITGVADGCIDITSDTDENLHVSFSNLTGVYTSIYNYLLTEILAPTLVETVANVDNVIKIPALNQVIYQVRNATPSLTSLRSNTVTAGVVGTPTLFKWSVGIASKPFSFENKWMFATIYQSPLQSTYFILDQAAVVVAKLNAGTGGTLRTFPTYVPAYFNEYLFANQLKGAIDSENNISYAPLGVNITNMSFTSENRFQNVQLGALHITGGILQSYDGVSVVEHGFHLYPEGVSVAAAAAGALAAGSYLYSVCYEWTDNLGQIQRSAPSVPVSITLPVGSTLTKTGATIVSGSKVITTLSNTTDLYPGMVVANANIPVGSKIVSVDSSTQITIDLAATGSAGAQSISSTSTNAVNVTIPTLKITAKTGPLRTDVRCVVYRTTANGNVFRRVSSVTTPTFNSTTSASVVFVDHVSDATSLSNDTLYTTGGVLENIAPPACALIATWQSRVVIAGLEDTLSFWYSKQRTEGSPVEFTGFFTARVDGRGGPITALGVIDSNLIIFKSNSIYALSGNGPNDTGSMNDLSQAQLITTDVGCTNPNSVVITPEGLMFKSTKGIHLLSRGLQASYIGAEVEAFNPLLITASELISNTNQVRFITNENICLVYDYFFRQWSTFTNHTANDSAVYTNRYTFLRPSGEVWVENDTYIDKASFIKLRLTTSWMSLAGLQGFERVYRMSVLGEYKSPHQLLVSMGYNFSPIMTQFATIDVDSVIDLSTYGTGDYGVLSPYGGEYPLYQFKTHMTKQKCQSVRFRFEDNQNSSLGEYGEGFSITNMALEVGIKGTLNKGATKNSFGTST